MARPRITLRLLLYINYIISYGRTQFTSSLNYQPSDEQFQTRNCRWPSLQQNVFNAGYNALNQPLYQGPTVCTTPFTWHRFGFNGPRVTTATPEVKYYASQPSFVECDGSSKADTIMGGHDPKMTFNLPGVSPSMYAEAKMTPSVTAPSVRMDGGLKVSPYKVAPTIFNLGVEIPRTIFGNCINLAKHMLTPKGTSLNNNLAYEVNPIGLTNETPIMPNSASSTTYNDKTKWNAMIPTTGINTADFCTAVNTVNAQNENPGRISTYTKAPTTIEGSTAALQDTRLTEFDNGGNYVYPTVHRPKGTIHACLAGYDNEIYRIINDIKETQGNEIEVHFYLFSNCIFNHLCTHMTNVRDLQDKLAQYHHYICLNKKYVESYNAMDQCWYIQKLIMIPGFNHDFDKLNDDLRVKEFSDMCQLTGKIKHKGFQPVVLNVQEKVGKKGENLNQVMEIENKEEVSLYDLVQKTRDKSKQTQADVKNDDYLSMTSIGNCEGNRFEKVPSKTVTYTTNLQRPQSNTYTIREHGALNARQNQEYQGNVIQGIPPNLPGYICTDYSETEDKYSESREGTEFLPNPLCYTGAGNKYPSLGYNNYYGQKIMPNFNDYNNVQKPPESGGEMYNLPYNVNGLGKRVYYGKDSAGYSINNNGIVSSNYVSPPKVGSINNDLICTQYYGNLPQAYVTSYGKTMPGTDGYYNIREIQQELPLKSVAQDNSAYIQEGYTIPETNKINLKLSRLNNQFVQYSSNNQPFTASFDGTMNPQSYPKVNIPYYGKNVIQFPNNDDITYGNIQTVGNTPRELGSHIVWYNNPQPDKAYDNKRQTFDPGSVSYTPFPKLPHEMFGKEQYNVVSNYQIPDKENLGYATMQTLIPQQIMTSPRTMKEKYVNVKYNMESPYYTHSVPWQSMLQTTPIPDMKRKQKYNTYTVKTEPETSIIQNIEQYGTPQSKLVPDLKTPFVIKADNTLTQNANQYPAGGLEIPKDNAALEEMYTVSSYRPYKESITPTYSINPVEKRKYIPWAQYATLPSNIMFREKPNLNYDIYTSNVNKKEGPESAMEEKTTKEIPHEGFPYPQYGINSAQNPPINGGIQEDRVVLEKPESLNLNTKTESPVKFHVPNGPIVSSDQTQFINAKPGNGILPIQWNAYDPNMPLYYRTNYYSPRLYFHQTAGTDILQPAPIIDKIEQAPCIQIETPESLKGIKAPQISNTLTPYNRVVWPGKRQLINGIPTIEYDDNAFNKPPYNPISSFIPQTGQYGASILQAAPITDQIQQESIAQQTNQKPDNLRLITKAPEGYIATPYGGFVSPVTDQFVTATPEYFKPEYGSFSSNTPPHDHLNSNQPQAEQIGVNIPQVLIDGKTTLYVKPFEQVKKLLTNAQPSTGTVVTPYGPMQSPEKGQLMVAKPAFGIPSGIYDTVDSIKTLYDKINSYSPQMKLIDCQIPQSPYEEIQKPDYSKFIKPQQPMSTIRVPCVPIPENDLFLKTKLDYNLPTINYNSIPQLYNINNYLPQMRQTGKIPQLTIDGVIPKSPYVQIQKPNNYKLFTKPQSLVGNMMGRPGNVNLITPKTSYGIPLRIYNAVASNTPQYLPKMIQTGGTISQELPNYGNNQQPLYSQIQTVNSVSPIEVQEPPIGSIITPSKVILDPEKNQLETAKPNFAIPSMKYNVISSIPQYDKRMSYLPQMHQFGSKIPRIVQSNSYFGPYVAPVQTTNRFQFFTNLLPKLTANPEIGKLTANTKYGIPSMKYGISCYTPQYGGFKNYLPQMEQFSTKIRQMAPTDSKIQLAPSKQIWRPENFRLFTKAQPPIGKIVTPYDGFLDPRKGHFMQGKPTMRYNAIPSYVPLYDNVNSYLPKMAQKGDNTAQMITTNSRIQQIPCIQIQRQDYIKPFAKLQQPANLVAPYLPITNPANGQLITAIPGYGVPLKAHVSINSNIPQLYNINSYLPQTKRISSGLPQTSPADGKIQQVPCMKFQNSDNLKFITEAQPSIGSIATPYGEFESSATNQLKTSQPEIVKYDTLFPHVPQYNNLNTYLPQIDTKAPQVIPNNGKLAPCTIIPDTLKPITDAQLRTGSTVVPYDTIENLEKYQPVKANPEFDIPTKEYSIVPQHNTINSYLPQNIQIEPKILPVVPIDGITAPWVAPCVTIQENAQPALSSEVAPFGTISDPEKDQLIKVNPHIIQHHDNIKSYLPETVQIGSQMPLELPTDNKIQQTPCAQIKKPENSMLSTKAHPSTGIKVAQYPSLGSIAASYEPTASPEKDKFIKAAPENHLLNISLNVPQYDNAKSNLPKTGRIPAKPQAVPPDLTIKTPQTPCAQIQKLEISKLIPKAQQTISSIPYGGSISPKTGELIQATPKFGIPSKDHDVVSNAAQYNNIKSNRPQSEQQINDKTLKIPIDGKIQLPPYAPIQKTGTLGLIPNAQPHINDIVAPNEKVVALAKTQLMKPENGISSTRYDVISSNVPQKKQIGANMLHTVADDGKVQKPVGLNTFTRLVSPHVPTDSPKRDQIIQPGYGIPSIKFDTNPQNIPQYYYDNVNSYVPQKVQIGIKIPQVLPTKVFTKTQPPLSSIVSKYKPISSPEKDNLIKAALEHGIPSIKYDSAATSTPQFDKILSHLPKNIQIGSGVTKLLPTDCKTQPAPSIQTPKPGNPNFFTKTQPLINSMVEPDKRFVIPEKNQSIKPGNGIPSMRKDIVPTNIPQNGHIDTYLPQTGHYDADIPQVSTDGKVQQAPDLQIQTPDILEPIRKPLQRIGTSVTSYIPISIPEKGSYAKPTLDYGIPTTEYNVITSNIPKYGSTESYLPPMVQMGGKILQMLPPDDKTQQAPCAHIHKPGISSSITNAQPSTGSAVAPCERLVDPGESQLIKSGNDIPSIRYAVISPNIRPQTEQQIGDKIYQVPMNGKIQQPSYAQVQEPGISRFIPKAQRPTGKINTPNGKFVNTTDQLTSAKSDYNISPAEYNVISSNTPQYYNMNPFIPQTRQSDAKFSQAVPIVVNTSPCVKYQKPETLNKLQPPVSSIIAPYGPIANPEKGEFTKTTPNYGIPITENGVISSNILQNDGIDSYLPKMVQIGEIIPQAVPYGSTKTFNVTPFIQISTPESTFIKQTAEPNRGIVLNSENYQLTANPEYDKPTMGYDVIYSNLPVSDKLNRAGVTTQTPITTTTDANLTTPPPKLDNQILHATPIKDTSTKSILATLDQKKLPVELNSITPKAQPTVTKEQTNFNTLYYPSTLTPAMKPKLLPNYYNSLLKANLNPSNIASPYVTPENSKKGPHYVIPNYIPTQYRVKPTYGNIQYYLPQTYPTFAPQMFVKENIEQHYDIIESTKADPNHGNMPTPWFKTSAYIPQRGFPRSYTTLAQQIPFKQNIEHHFDIFESTGGDPYRELKTTNDIPEEGILGTYASFAPQVPFKQNIEPHYNNFKYTEGDSYPENIPTASLKTTNYRPKDRIPITYDKYATQIPINKIIGQSLITRPPYENMKPNYENPIVMPLPATNYVPKDTHIMRYSTNTTPFKENIEQPYSIIEPTETKPSYPQIPFAPFQNTYFSPQKGSLGTYGIFGPGKKRINQLYDDTETQIKPNYGNILSMPLETTTNKPQADTPVSYVKYTHQMPINGNLGQPLIIRPLNKNIFVSPKPQQIQPGDILDPPIVKPNYSYIPFRPLQSKRYLPQVGIPDRYDAHTSNMPIEENIGQHYGVLESSEATPNFERIPPTETSTNLKYGLNTPYKPLQTYDSAELNKPQVRTTPAYEAFYGPPIYYNIKPDGVNIPTMSDTMYPINYKQINYRPEPYNYEKEFRPIYNNNYYTNMYNGPYETYPGYETNQYFTSDPNGIPQYYKGNMKPLNLVKPNYITAYGPLQDVQPPNQSAINDIVTPDNPNQKTQQSYQIPSHTTSQKTSQQYDDRKTYLTQMEIKPSTQINLFGKKPEFNKGIAKKIEHGMPHLVGKESKPKSASVGSHIVPEKDANPHILSKKPEFNKVISNAHPHPKKADPDVVHLAHKETKPKSALVESAAPPNNTKPDIKTTEYMKEKSLAPEYAITLSNETSVKSPKAEDQTKSSKMYITVPNQPYTEMEEVNKFKVNTTPVKEGNKVTDVCSPDKQKEDIKYIAQQKTEVKPKYQTIQPVTPQQKNQKFYFDTVPASTPNLTTNKPQIANKPIYAVNQTPFPTNIKLENTKISSNSPIKVVSPQPNSIKQDLSFTRAPKYDSSVLDDPLSVLPKYGKLISNTLNNVLPKYGKLISNTLNNVLPKYNSLLPNGLQNALPNYNWIGPDTSQILKPEYNSLVANLQQNETPKYESQSYAPSITTKPYYNPQAYLNLPINNAEEQARNINWYSPYQNNIKPLNDIFMSNVMPNVNPIYGKTMMPLINYVKQQPATVNWYAPHQNSLKPKYYNLMSNEIQNDKLKHDPAYRLIYGTPLYENNNWPCESLKYEENIQPPRKTEETIHQTVTPYIIPTKQIYEYNTIPSNLQHSGNLIKGDNLNLPPQSLSETTGLPTSSYQNVYDTRYQPYPSNYNLLQRPIPSQSRSLRPLLRYKPNFATISSYAEAPKYLEPSYTTYIPDTYSQIQVPSAPSYRQDNSVITSNTQPSQILIKPGNVPTTSFATQINDEAEAAGPQGAFKTMYYPQAQNYLNGQHNLPCTLQYANTMPDNKPGYGTYFSPAQVSMSNEPYKATSGYPSVYPSLHVAPTMYPKATMNANLPKSDSDLTKPELKQIYDTSPLQYTVTNDANTNINEPFNEMGKAYQNAVCVPIKYDEYRNVISNIKNANPYYDINNIDQNTPHDKYTNNTCICVLVHSNDTSKEPVIDMLKENLAKIILSNTDMLNVLNTTDKEFDIPLDNIVLANVLDHTNVSVCKLTHKNFDLKRVTSNVKVIKPRLILSEENMDVHNFIPIVQTDESRSPCLVQNLVNDEVQKVHKDPIVLRKSNVKKYPCLMMNDLCRLQPGGALIWPPVYSSNRWLQDWWYSPH